jgi:hypothetical protein
MSALAHAGIGLDDGKYEWLYIIYTETTASTKSASQMRIRQRH